MFGIGEPVLFGFGCFVNLAWLSVVFWLWVFVILVMFPGLVPDLVTLVLLAYGLAVLVILVFSE